MATLWGHIVSNYSFAFNRKLSTCKAEALANASRVNHTIASIDELNFVV